MSLPRLSGKQAVFIDEIGPLELGEKGWSKAIDNICRNTNIPQIWIVRKNLVPLVIKKWNVGNIYIFKISEDDILVVQKLLLGIINPNQETDRIN